MLRSAFVLAVFLITGLGVFLRWGEMFELTTLDWRYRHRYAPPSHPEIIIIEIGEDTLHRIGQWPISRKWHTQLIHALKTAGAKAILLNFLFLQPSEEDAELAEAISQAKNVYLPVIAQSGYSDKPLTPVASLAAAAQGVGQVNMTTDKDGKVRRFPLQSGGYLSLPYLTAQDCGYLRSTGELPMDEEGNLGINFAGKWSQTFRHYSFLQVIESYAQELKGGQGKIPLSDFRDSVCFVGLTAAGTEQTLSTPLESHYPMIGLLANGYNTFLQKKWIKKAGVLWSLVIAWCFVLLGLAAPYFGKRLRAIFILTAVGVGYSLIAWGLFARFGLWLDWVYPLTLLVIGGVISLTRQAVAEQHQQDLLQRELDVAYQIQQHFLPSPIPQSEGLSIAAKMIPARHIGGDFYDVVSCGNDGLAVMIGDVSGKGIPAALCMAILSNEFRTLIQREAKASEVLRGLNRHLWNKRLKVFVTMSLLVYHKSEGSFTYVNAGHLPLLKVSRGRNQVEILDLPGGPPLGTMPEADFEESRIPVEKESYWFLYTDGILEAKNRQGDFFGEKRLYLEIEKRVAKSAEEFLESVVGKVMEFQIGKDLSDDLTLLVVNSY